MMNHEFQKSFYFQTFSNSCSSMFVGFVKHICQEWPAWGSMHDQAQDVTPTKQHMELFGLMASYRLSLSACLGLIQMKQDHHCPRAHPASFSMSRLGAWANCRACPLLSRFGTAKITQRLIWNHWVYTLTDPFKSPCNGVKFPRVVVRLQVFRTSCISSSAEAPATWELSEHDVAVNQCKWLQMGEVAHRQAGPSLAHSQALPLSLSQHTTWIWFRLMMIDNRLAGSSLGPPLSNYNFGPSSVRLGCHSSLGNSWASSWMIHVHHGRLPKAEKTNQTTISTDHHPVLVKIQTKHTSDYSRQGEPCL